MENKYFAILALLAFSSAVIAGCSRAIVTQTVSVSNGSGEYPGTSQVAYPTLTRPYSMVTVSQPGAIPSLTTNSIIPTRTKIPLPALISTWTPIPTLAPGAITKTIMQYYKNNGGCQLPCWWGITPGQTSWQEVREILSPISQEQGPFVKSGAPRYDYSLPISEEPLAFPSFPYIEPKFWMEDKIVSIININSQWIQQNFDYSLSGVLNTLGMPEEIWIKVRTDTPNLPPYELFLFYPTKGILLASNGETRVDGQNLLVCPQKFRLGNFPPALFLFSPNISYSFSQLGKITGRFDADDFILLEDMDDKLDEKAFFDAYSNPGTKTCITIDTQKIP
jgi:hypothetical protein